MNMPGSSSESTNSSCKKHENGDAVTATDRPLKKARFAWQVKGKYHLKNDISDNKSAISTLDDSNAGSSLENESECKEMSSNTKPNLETLGARLEQDLCTLDSMTKSDQQLLPNINVSQEKFPYPRCNDTKCILAFKDELENRCIERWQAEQRADGCLDNTINRFIERWMRGPLDIEVDEYAAFEPLQYLNNDDSIENEGILMAISAHGLQNASSSSDTFLSPPSSPQFEDNIDSNTGFNTPPQELSSDSYRSYTDTDNQRNQLGFHTDNCINNCTDIETYSPFDVLDTALSIAIQYKGLTSSSDFG